MGAHAYIEAEDLGLTVLGTIQNAYAVNGVHGQDFGTAVYMATLCRTAALPSPRLLPALPPATAQSRTACWPR